MPSLKIFFKRFCPERRQNIIIEPDLTDYEIVTDQIDNECIICLGPFTSGEHATLIRCGHIYHTTCLYRWFVKRNTCPICDINIEI